METTLVTKSADQSMSERKKDIQRFRDKPDEIAAYLSDIFDENDYAALLLAIKRVMRAQNVQALAQDAGLRRDRLYKTFGGKIDPHLSRVMTLFDALGVRFTVRALPPRTIPKRARLGRPPKKTAAGERL